MPGKNQNQSKARNGTKGNSNVDLLGKLPPAQVDLEKAILSAMMLEKPSCMLALSLINEPEMFYQEAHHHIFVAIRDLQSEHLPVDMLTVASQLRKTGMLEIVGGPYYLTLLSSTVNSGEHLEFHIQLVKEAFYRRRLIRAAQLAHQKAFDDTFDVFELLEEVQDEINQVSNDLSVKKAVTMRSGILQAFQQIQNAMAAPDGITGVPSGLSDIDRLTGGWQKSDLIIIAGRPSMGKTTFALQVAKNASVGFKIKGTVFSLEMSTTQLCMKLISNSSESYSTSQLVKGRISIEQVTDLQTRSKDLLDGTMMIDDTPGMSVQQLCAKATVSFYEYGIEYIVVDYLQLLYVAGFSGTREQEISLISRMLKQLAKKLNIPVIVLSQLSRAVESRPDKRPQLSDLRESGSIEQDADVVIFCFRPEYYKIEVDENGNSLKDVMFAIFAKHRQGSLMDIELRCKMRYSAVYDKSDPEANSPFTPDKPGKSENLPDVIDQFNKKSALQGFSGNDFEKDKAPF